MAFSYNAPGDVATANTVEYNVFGSKRAALCQFTNSGGSTGGTISTGLSTVDYIFSTPAATSYTISAGNVTIVTAANAVGSFQALGS